MAEYAIYKCPGCHYANVTRSGLYCLICSEMKAVNMSEAVRTRVLIRMAGKQLKSWLISDCK